MTRAVTKKPPATQPKKKPVPPPGRKLSKQDARDFVFKTYAETMKLLAKH